MVAGVSNATFNHHDPTTPEGHSYLSRTVARWNRILASPGRKLMALVCVDAELWEADEVAALFRQLGGRTENFVMVAVFCEQGTGESSAALTSRLAEPSNSSELIVYHMRCIGRCTGQHWQVPEDADTLASLLLFPPREGRELREPHKFKLLDVPV